MAFTATLSFCLFSNMWGLTTVDECYMHHSGSLGERRGDLCNSDAQPWHE